MAGMEESPYILNSRPQATPCTCTQTNDVLLEFPGQGMQHSGSAALHSGTGSAPDSSDEQILQNCRADCSTVCCKALLKATARLQTWEVKDGNIDKNQRKKKETARRKADQQGKS